MERIDSSVSIGSMVRMVWCGGGVCVGDGCGGGGGGDSVLVMGWCGTYGVVLVCVWGMVVVVWWELWWG